MIPTDRSPALGIYVGFSAVASGTKLPVPVVVHVTLDVPPPIVPLNTATSFEQMV